MSSGASISGMPLSRHQIEQAKWGESRELRVWRVLYGGCSRICCDSARLSERPLVLRLLSRQSGRTEGTWRTPERRLLFLALLGPFGALGAMRAFRHKTRKTKFWLVPIFLCLQIGLFAALVLFLV
ncbi:DUF1294 domain-containing protein [Methanoculleus bourgensis]|uniref:DUF1294 domain-containing protein n=1 Tax=Methanoculleus bourgensis TaxID=83986 RepID=A0A110BIL8_9EURY|nr:DUF1294 domain-containing protein [Methanoculleus bourgensis]CVK34609.1 protein of unknown function [Methanoculleus bourgensis]